MEISPTRHRKQRLKWRNFINKNLVGGLEHEFYDFPYIGNNSPNWLVFFRGVETTNQELWSTHKQCWDTKEDTPRRPRNVSNNGPEAMTRVMLRVGHQQTWSNEAQIGGLPAKGFKQQECWFCCFKNDSDWWTWDQWNNKNMEISPRNMAISWPTC